MEIDIDDTVEKLLGALKKEVGECFETISALLKEQARRLAAQSSMIFQARAVGCLRDDDELFEFFVNKLNEMAENFARTVATLTALTLERAWNALVKVIWGVINTALKGVGLAILPIPRSPVA